MAIVDDLLRQGLPALGIPADDRLVASFARFLALLAQWNENINLTAIREPAAMVPLHILDSLTARPFLKGERIVDVGCGAGLPGLPLAMLEPGRHFTLVDGTLKKIRFVQAAIAEIIRQGVAAGKVVGMNCPTGEAAARERARGVRLTSVAMFGLLAAGARGYLAAAG